MSEEGLEDGSSACQPFFGGCLVRSFGVWGFRV